MNRSTAKNLILLYKKGQGFSNKQLKKLLPELFPDEQVTKKTGDKGGKNNRHNTMS